MTALHATPELVILILTIGQSLFFGAYLLAAYRHNSANIFLAGFMLAFAVLRIGEFFLEFGAWPEVNIFTLPLDALLAPLMYLYVVKLTSPSPDTLPDRLLLHLSAFLIALLLIVPWGLLPFELKHLPIVLDLGWFGPIDGNLWPVSDSRQAFSWQTAPAGLLTAALSLLLFIGLYQLQVTFYVIMLILVFRQHRKHIRQNFSDIEDVKLQWLGFLCIACVAFWLTTVPAQLFVAAFGAQAEQIQGIAQLAITYALGFVGMRQPAVYAPGTSWVTSTDVPAMQDQGSGVAGEASIASPPSKYVRSGLSRGDMERIAQKLQHTMRSERLYLESSLTLPQLANRTKISVNHISQVLNTHLGMNFFDFVNGFRVDTAKQHLLAGDMTILDVAYASGFNSKSTFNAAFKKIAGLTPGRFRSKPAETVLAVPRS